MIPRIARRITVIGCLSGCSSRSETSNIDASTHASDGGLPDSASSGDAVRSEADTSFEGLRDASADVSRPFSSCAPGGPGMSNCGPSQESCCTSLEVECGTYYRTYDSVDEDGSFE